ncbi:PREDICTED: uncharacterized protein C10orf95-like [Chrysochloris asiatica]|uniref:Uncharacterized protein C10orf95-like n=1 Tax=Chrysochloris asiatica TaxID=185453 RepID=A0A9B0TW82_CHRAS|nr:PREDICTED: uncharacterized protein C10orf95-like [Chrysochloris asiatica]
MATDSCGKRQQPLTSRDGGGGGDPARRRTRRSRDRGRRRERRRRRCPGRLALRAARPSGQALAPRAAESSLPRSSGSAVGLSAPRSGPRARRPVPVARDPRRGDQAGPRHQPVSTPRLASPPPAAADWRRCGSPHARARFVYAGRRHCSLGAQSPLSLGTGRGPAAVLHWGRTTPEPPTPVQAAGPVSSAAAWRGRPSGLVGVGVTGG